MKKEICVAAAEIALVKKYIEFYNSFDVFGMLSCLSDCVVFENLVDGKTTHKTRGKSEFSILAQESVKIFKTRKQEVISWSSEKGKLIVELNFSGTLSENFKADDSESQDVRITGRSEFRFHNNKISEIRDIH